MADKEKLCYNCIHCERDSSSNSGWYCNYNRTHVRPDDARESCFKSK